MGIRTLQLTDLLKKNDDIYEKVVVASKRTRQIIDSRMDMFDAFNEDIEDSEELENLDEDIDYDLDKAIVLSVNEFLNNELEWSYEEDKDEGEL